jgi:hypothetical protein
MGWWYKQNSCRETKAINCWYLVADMSPERNTLMEHAYPKLKEYCRQKYRFEFQVNHRMYDLL